MRIVHLTSHLDVGGVPRSVVTVAAGMRRRGHTVRVASGGGVLEPELSSAGVEHWTVPLRTSVEFSPAVWRAARALRARLQRDPADLLHAHTRVGQVVAARLARDLRLPWVATWHGFFRPNLGRRLWPCTGDRTIAISEPVRQHLIREFHVAPERIRLILHGIDPAPFTTPVSEEVRRQFRLQAGLSEGARVIGTMARLVPSKRVEFLVDAFREIRAAVPAAELLVVGDGSERRALEARADRLGVGRAAHFVGSLPESRVALAMMDVFAFIPAEQEGFGLSLLEAMAAGRPIVGMRRGQGAAWVLEQGGVDALVEDGDVAGLGRAVIRLLQDGERACRSAGEARRVLLERYALDRMLNDLDAVYRELVP